VLREGFLRKFQEATTERQIVLAQRLEGRTITTRAGQVVLTLFKRAGKPWSDFPILLNENVSAHRAKEFKVGVVGIVDPHNSDLVFVQDFPWIIHQNGY
jgi:hypothetical protein